MLTCDQRSLLLLSIRSALLAGEAILNYYKQKNLSVGIKRDFSPITIADRQAHEIISGQLAVFGIPLLSEEGTHFDYTERKEWNNFWLIDPLDGTKEFLKRNGEFTVNIAYIQDNLPVLGVVYAPDLNRLYYASSDIGAYYMDVTQIKDFEPESIDKIISISDMLPVKPKHRAYTIVASRSHRNFETRKKIKILRREQGNVDIITIGSSLKFCLVAEGTADIYPRFGPTMEWDTAAGQAIAVYSGCSVKRHDTGEVLTYNKEHLKNPWFVVERVQRG